jgi:hypothetical protein
VRRAAVEPGGRALSEFVDRGVGAVGGDGGLEASPDVLAGVELGGAEGEPGQLDVAVGGGLAGDAGVVGWGVVPDQQGGSRSGALGEGGHGGGDVVAPPARAERPDEVTGDDVDHAVHDAPGVAPADDDRGLLPDRRPGCAQRREFAQGRLVTEPDAPALLQDRRRARGDGPRLVYLRVGGVGLQPRSRG